MAKRKVRVGMVGAGGIAQGCHIPGWQTNGDVEVIAVCDIDIDRAAQAGEKFSIPHVSKDFKKMVTMKEIDIIDVCTPNRVHTPSVMAALEAGKHVICEKPLAVTTAEIKKMMQLAKKKKRKLMTAQHQRFGGDAVAAKAYIDSGNVGKVYHTRVKALRRDLLPVSPGFIDGKLSGGGPCMDIGVHALDLAMYLLKFPKPVYVTGTAKMNFAKGDTFRGAWGGWDKKRFNVEDFAVGFVHFDDGSTMILESSWLGHYSSKNAVMKCELFGETAALEWPSLTFSTAEKQVISEGQLTPVSGMRPAHTEELFAFYDCVVNNKPSPVPPEETIKVIAILEGIYRSEKKGHEVKV